MNICCTILLFAALTFPITSYAADILNFPDTLGSDPALTRAGVVQSWDPENMFEHVNGEAELLKRFGAASLTFVSYENDNGDYFSIDVLDMREPINAYGLYRLYTGCDDTEYKLSEATVLPDEYAPQALRGRYYFRFNVDITGDTDRGEKLVEDFLKKVISGVPKQPALPAVLEKLQQKALQPCEVNYHPEHVDYDLESGPGYTWIGPDQQSYFLTFLPSVNEAELHAESLKNRGLTTALLLENAVIWQKNDENRATAYMEEILTEVIAK